MCRSVRQQFAEASDEMSVYALGSPDSFFDSGSNIKGRYVCALYSCIGTATALCDTSDVVKQ